MRPATFILLLTTITFSYCSKKDLPNDEAALYGVWVKGSNTGDTLRFVQKNGKNVVLYNQSFNPLFNAPTESEYTYRNGKLAIKGYLGGTNFFPVDSFNWKQVGKKFEIQGSILFPFMAATIVLFTYQKI